MYKALLALCLACMVFACGSEAPEASNTTDYAPLYVGDWTGGLFLKFVCPTCDPALESEGTFLTVSVSSPDAGQIEIHGFMDGGSLTPYKSPIWGTWVIPNWNYEAGPVCTVTEQGCTFVPPRLPDGGIRSMEFGEYAVLQDGRNVWDFKEGSAWLDENGYLNVALDGGYTNDYDARLPPGVQSLPFVQVFVANFRGPYGSSCNPSSSTGCP